MSISAGSESSILPTSAPAAASLPVQDMVGAGKAWGLCTSVDLQDCNPLIKDDAIVLRFLNGRSIDAKERWWLAGACGVQFSTVLSSDDPLLAGKVDYFSERKRF